MIGDDVSYLGSDSKTHKGKLAAIVFRPEHYHCGIHHDATWVGVVLHNQRYVVVPLDAIENQA